MDKQSPPQPTEPTQPFDGPERRNPAQQDRRTARGGGRRASDLLKDVATFVHQLLTEPPR